VLQALHEGPAVREFLHQRQGQVPPAAGVRMLTILLLFAPLREPVQLR
jgi:hypothetical protein